MGTLDAIVGGSNSPSAIMNHTARYHTTQHTRSTFVSEEGRRTSRGGAGGEMMESEWGKAEMAKHLPNE